ncbi:MAG: hypothetical protein JNL34_06350 [Anaerolineae bacterium]|nr:hypothetical protein [Anaerolineae bacterium]
MTGQTPTCPRCQIGVLKPELATYAGVYRGLFISAPSLPCYCCDVCGHREFDERALAHLDALVGQLSLPHEPVRSPAKPAAADPDASDLGRQPPLKR